MSTQVSATVLMSGGIDSTACAHHLLRQSYVVDAVFIDYNQAARQKEFLAAKSIASILDIPFRSLSIDGIAPSGPGELLGRNALLLFLTLFAIRLQSRLLAIGVHAGTPYYDCSSSFLDTMARTIQEHTDGRVSVIAPFLTWSKSDIYSYFLSSALPVKHTYSCEAGTEPPCGLCASCRDRRMLGC